MTKVYNTVEEVRFDEEVTLEDAKAMLADKNNKLNKQVLEDLIIEWEECLADND